MTAYTWATVWPPICLLTTITIVYSVIQPLITILALLAFCMIYAAYKYQLGWCADQPDHIETGGLFYIKAIRTVFVALYLEGICLAGLFFLSTDASGGRAPSGIACGVIMVSLPLACSSPANARAQSLHCNRPLLQVSSPVSKSTSTGSPSANHTSSSPTLLTLLREVTVPLRNPSSLPYPPTPSHSPNRPDPNWAIPRDSTKRHSSTPRCGRSSPSFGLRMTGLV